MEDILPWIIPVIFIILWVLICAAIKSMIGFSKSIEYSEAEKHSTDKSGWGSARIKLVGLNNCVRVYKVNEGFLFKLMLIFGGGYRIVKSSDIINVTSTSGSFFRPKRAVITTNQGNIVVYGSLADLIEKYSSNKIG